MLRTILQSTRQFALQRVVFPAYAFGFAACAFVFLFASPVVGQDIDAFYDAVDRFMAANVEDGLVDYEGVKGDPAQLEELLGMIREMDRSTLPAQDDKAFLINAYNVLVIKNVVDHYPLDSPLDVRGFFDQATFEVASNPYTLNELEKETLFEAYPDARLHFVLVCAAVGCPELIPEAYRAGALDDMLAERTRIVLNNEKHVRTDASAERHQISELFSWYKQDFTEGGTDVVGYINQFRDDRLEEGYKVGFITYDWQLNDLKKKG